MIDVQRTAVLIIDLQNDYCHPDGAFAQRGIDVASMGAAATQTQQLVEWARVHHVSCIYVRTEHSQWFDSQAWRQRGHDGDILDVESVPIVVQDSWGAEPYLLKAEHEDLVIVKHRYSAFAYTPLELALSSQGITTLVVGGVTTNVCVRQTVMDAVMRGWHTVVVSDCTAAPSAAEHERALLELTQYAGKVVSLEQLVESK